MRTYIFAAFLLIVLALPALAQFPIEPPQNPDPNANANANVAAPLPKTQENNSRALGSRDFATPMSSVRWGRWSLYSASLTSSYSNQPLSGQDQFSATPGFGMNQGPSVMLNGSATMGATIPMSRGFLSFRYTPMFERQSAYSFTEVNHRVNLAWDHEFGGKAWRMSFGIDGGTYNRFSTFFDQGRLTSLVQQQTRLNTADLQNILSEPQGLQPMAQDLVVLANRYFQGQASFTLTRSLTPRDSLSFNTGYFLHRTLDHADSTQTTLLQDVNTNGRSFGASYNHTITSRQHVGMYFSDQESEGAGITTESRSAGLSYSWAPSPHWEFGIGAGPSLMSSNWNRTRLSTAVHGSVGFNLQSSMIHFGYSRDFYAGGLPGAQQGDSVMLEWAPRPHGHRWRYSLSGGYQWLNSLDGLQVAAGWSIRPTFMIPITRSLLVQTSYGYFHQDQGIGQRTVAGAPSLLSYQRNLVTIGLVWNFTRQGDAGQNK